MILDKGRKMEETTICRICLEPIYNFICVDCFAEQIEKILPERLKFSFNKFHNSLKENFSTNENLELCLKCRQQKDVAICPYCYFKEVFLWVVERDENYAEKIAEIFNFNFEKTEFRKSIKVKNWEPIIISESNEEFDFNVCEICGEPKELRKIDGKWVCETCAEEL